MTGVPIQYGHNLQPNMPAFPALLPEDVIDQ